MVSQYHYALYHNEKFFAKPEEFHPERWLGDPEFATDNRDVFRKSCLLALCTAPRKLIVI